LEREGVRPLRGGSGGGVGRAGDEPGTVMGRDSRRPLPSSAVCVREDDADDDEPEAATSSDDTSADAAGLFQSLYTLCIAGFLARASGDGDGGFGATYPIDITSPRWLAWMPGIVIIFACGWTCMRGGVAGSDGSRSRVLVRLTDGEPRFAVLSAVAVAARAMKDGDGPFCDGRPGCIVSARSRTSGVGIGIGVDGPGLGLWSPPPRRRSATAALTSA
jgi:hypothetical protein